MIRLEIIDYQPLWPQEFDTLARRLRESLEPDEAAIHHIGSTSVPGLAAKDIIDIQVTVGSLDETGFRSGVEAAGFAWIEFAADHAPPGLDVEPVELEKRTAVSTSRPANLHLRVASRFNQRYALLFRDYLRAVPRAAAVYADVKRSLVLQSPDDLDAYYAVKDPVCEIIMAGAEGWAGATGWQLPPSDA